MGSALWPTLGHPRSRPRRQVRQQKIRPEMSKEEKKKAGLSVSDT